MVNNIKNIFTRKKVLIDFIKTERCKSNYFLKSQIKVFVKKKSSIWVSK